MPIYFSKRFIRWKTEKNLLDQNRGSQYTKVTRPKKKTQDPELRHCPRFMKRQTQ